MAAKGGPTWYNGNPDLSHVYRTKGDGIADIRAHFPGKKELTTGLIFRTSRNIYRTVGGKENCEIMSDHKRIQELQAEQMETRQQEAQKQLAARSPPPGGDVASRSLSPSVPSSPERFRGELYVLDTFSLGDLKDLWENENLDTPSELPQDAFDGPLASLGGQGGKFGRQISREYGYKIFKAFKPLVDKADEWLRQERNSRAYCRFNWRLVLTRPTNPVQHQDPHIDNDDSKTLWTMIVPLNFDNSERLTGGTEFVKHAEELERGLKVGIECPILFNCKVLHRGLGERDIERYFLMLTWDVEDGDNPNPEGSFDYHDDFMRQYSMEQSGGTLSDDDSSDDEEGGSGASIVLGIDDLDGGDEKRGDDRDESPVAAPRRRRSRPPSADDSVDWERATQSRGLRKHYKVVNILSREQAKSLKDTILEGLDLDEAISGTGQHVVYRLAQDLFLAKFPEESEKYKAEFERRHDDPEVALYPSSDGIIYWKKDMTINLTEGHGVPGGPHRDQGHSNEKATFQAMLLLTDQNEHTGGFAVSAAPEEDTMVTYVNEPSSGTKRSFLLNNDAAASEWHKEHPSKVVSAEAGDMIIWDSALWHHGKAPPDNFVTDTRLAILLAYNPEAPTPGGGASHYGRKPADAGASAAPVVDAAAAAGAADAPTMSDEKLKELKRQAITAGFKVYLTTNMGWGVKTNETKKAEGAWEYGGKVSPEPPENSAYVAEIAEGPTKQYIDAQGDRFEHATWPALVNHTSNPKFINAKLVQADGKVYIQLMYTPMPKGIPLYVDYGKSYTKGTPLPDPTDAKVVPPYRPDKQWQKRATTILAVNRRAGKNPFASDDEEDEDSFAADVEVELKIGYTSKQNVRKKNLKKINYKDINVISFTSKKPSIFSEDGFVDKLPHRDRPLFNAVKGDYDFMWAYVTMNTQGSDGTDEPSLKTVLFQAPNTVIDGSGEDHYEKDNKHAYMLYLIDDNKTIEADERFQALFFDEDQQEQFVNFTTRVKTVSSMEAAIGLFEMVEVLVNEGGDDIDDLDTVDIAVISAEDKPTPDEVEYHEIKAMKDNINYTLEIYADSVKIEVTVPVCVSMPDSEFDNKRYRYAEEGERTSAEDYEYHAYQETFELNTKEVGDEFATQLYSSATIVALALRELDSDQKRNKDEHYAFQDLLQRLAELSLVNLTIQRGFSQIYPVSNTRHKFYNPKDYDDDDAHNKDDQLGIYVQSWIGVRFLEVDDGTYHAAYKFEILGKSINFSKDKQIPLQLHKALYNAMTQTGQCTDMFYDCAAIVTRANEAAKRVLEPENNATMMARGLMDRVIQEHLKKPPREGQKRGKNLFLEQDDGDVEKEEELINKQGLVRMGSVTFTAMYNNLANINGHKDYQDRAETFAKRALKAYRKDTKAIKKEANQNKADATAAEAVADITWLNSSMTSLLGQFQDFVKDKWASFKGVSKFRTPKTLEEYVKLFYSAEKMGMTEDLCHELGVTDYRSVELELARWLARDKHKELASELPCSANPPPITIETTGYTEALKLQEDLKTKLKFATPRVTRPGGLERLKQAETAFDENTAVVESKRSELLADCEALYNNDRIRMARKLNEMVDTDLKREIITDLCKIQTVRRANAAENELAKKYCYALLRVAHEVELTEKLRLLNMQGFANQPLMNYTETLKSELLIFVSPEDMETAHTSLRTAIKEARRTFLDGHKGYGSNKDEIVAKKLNDIRLEQVERAIACAKVVEAAANPEHIKAARNALRHCKYTGTGDNGQEYEKKGDIIEATYRLKNSQLYKAKHEQHWGERDRADEIYKPILKELTLTSYQDAKNRLEHDFTAAQNKLKLLYLDILERDFKALEDKYWNEYKRIFREAFDLDPVREATIQEINECTAEGETQLAAEKGAESNTTADKKLARLLTGANTAELDEYEASSAFRDPVVLTAAERTDFWRNALDAWTKRTTTRIEALEDLNGRGLPSQVFGTNVSDTKTVAEVLTEYAATKCEGRGTLGITLKQAADSLLTRINYLISGVAPRPAKEAAEERAEERAEARKLAAELHAEQERASGVADDLEERATATHEEAETQRQLAEEAAEEAERLREEQQRLKQAAEDAAAAANEKERSGTLVDVSDAVAAIKDATEGAREAGEAAAARDAKAIALERDAGRLEEAGYALDDQQARVSEYADGVAAKEAVVAERGRVVVEGDEKKSVLVIGPGVGYAFHSVAFEALREKMKAVVAVGLPTATDELKGFAKDKIANKGERDDFIKSMTLTDFGSTRIPLDWKTPNVVAAPDEEDSLLAFAHRLKKHLDRFDADVVIAGGRGAQVVLPVLYAKRFGKAMIVLNAACLETNVAIPQPCRALFVTCGYDSSPIRTVEETRKRFRMLHTPKLEAKRSELEKQQRRAEAELVQLAKFPRSDVVQTRLQKFQSFIRSTEQIIREVNAEVAAITPNARMVHLPQDGHFPDFQSTRMRKLFLVNACKCLYNREMKEIDLGNRTVDVMRFDG